MHPSVYIPIKLLLFLSLFHILVTCNTFAFLLALCVPLHPILSVCAVNIPCTYTFPDLWGHKVIGPEFSTKTQY